MLLLFFFLTPNGLASGDQAPFDASSQRSTFPNTGDPDYIPLTDSQLGYSVGYMGDSMRASLDGDPYRFASASEGLIEEEEERSCCYQTFCCTKQQCLQDCLFCTGCTFASCGPACCAMGGFDLALWGASKCAKFALPKCLSLTLQICGPLGCAGGLCCCGTAAYCNYKCNTPGSSSYLWWGFTAAKQAFWCCCPKCLGG